MNSWKTLKRNSEHLYPFCFTLMKDQEMATELLINSLTQLAYHDHFSNLDDLNGDDILNPSRIQWNVSLAKAAYELSFNLASSSKSKGDRSFFFQLSKEARAVLFLKEEMSMSSEMIAQIMGLKKYEVLALVARAQDQLSHLMGKELRLN